MTGRNEFSWQNQQHCYLLEDDLKQNFVEFLYIGKHNGSVDWLPHQNALLANKHEMKHGSLDILIKREINEAFRKNSTATNMKLRSAKAVL